MNNPSPAAVPGVQKTVKKSKIIYVLLALLPTGYFGIAEFYIGRRILGNIILAATILMFCLPSDTENDAPSSDSEKTRSQVQEQKKVTESSDSGKKQIEKKQKPGSSDSEKTRSQAGEQQEPGSSAPEESAPKSDLQELIDFIPMAVVFLYFSSFISGFWYIRNNCQG